MWRTPFALLVSRASIGQLRAGRLYLRATREGFPDQFVLPAAEGDHTFAAEISRRHAQRLGAAFEDALQWPSDA